MTRTRYVLPIIVLAALTAPASAAQVTLTDTWQNLGTGPLILQTQGGDGLFEASAAAPTDNGVAIGKNQTPFAYPSTLAIWGKRRAQARNNVGASVNTTVVTTPMTLAGGSSGSSTGASPAAPTYINGGSGNLATNQTAATTTSGVLCAARAGRYAVTVENLGTTPVYVGASGVSTTTGALLPGAAGQSVTIPTAAAVYGVTSTGSQLVACLETY